MKIIDIPAVIIICMGGSKVIAVLCQDGSFKTVVIKREISIQLLMRSLDKCSGYLCLVLYLPLASHLKLHISYKSEAML